MFERNTVFIVGAGASSEINFPIGSDLTRIIAKKLDITFGDGWNQSNGDQTIAEAVRLHITEKGERDPNPYYRVGRDIAVGMRQAISIDNYLHAHANDDRLTWIGKLGIAASILEAERNCRLAINRERQTFDLSAVASSWYHPFFQMLTEGVQASNVRSLFDRVSFVAFNYDRCIEHFLVHALANYFRMDGREAEHLVNQMRIEHPYGQVGQLPWQNRQGLTAFGKEIHARDLPPIASQIRTFTEQVEDGDMINRAKRLIAEAEVVVYLGFSYGDMNMRLLSLDQAEDRAVFGTSLGISGPNKKVIEYDIIGAMGPVPDVVRSIELADMTCCDMLKAYWRPILRGPENFHT